MNKSDLLSAVTAICSEMESNKDLLISLDQQSGDGDLGISMTDGFNAVRSFLERSDEQDLGKLVMKSGSAFNEAAPSSLGTILSVGLMAMGKYLRGKETANFKEFAESFDEGLNGIMHRANSKPGEKTVLDSLCPAGQAYLDYVDDPQYALRQAKSSAEAGCESTRDMVAVHGRAARYGDKTLGMLDGGAVAGMLIIRGIFNAFYNGKE